MQEDRSGSEAALRRGRRIHLAIAAAVLALAVSVPEKASADVYIGAGIGPAIHIDDFPTQVRVEQEIGYYFGGRSGFFLGFAPSQSWASGFWTLVFPLGLGGMFDIHRSSSFTFQLGPMGTVGFALSDDDGRVRHVDPWFHLSAAFMLRFLVMDERLAFYVKPVGFEFFIGDHHHYRDDAIRYFLTGGIHYYF